MDKNKRFYVVGPPIKVWGKGRVKRIQEAMAKLEIPKDKFSIGMVLTIPVVTEYGEYHIITYLMENLKYLPADFAERIQEMVDPKMAGK
jgi:hypothetical protein